MGRPSEYTPEVGEAICARLAENPSVRQLCRDPDMPSRSAIYAWLEAHPDFADRYARARAIGLDHLADETLQIADDGSNDTYVDPETGEERTNHDVIQRSRLRVDTRKWLLSKLAPKKYGEKVALEHSTPPGSPLVVEHRAAPETLAEIAGVLAELASVEPAPEPAE